MGAKGGNDQLVPKHYGQCLLYGTRETRQYGASVQRPHYGYALLLPATGRYLIRPHYEDGKTKNADRTIPIDRVTWPALHR